MAGHLCRFLNEEIASIAMEVVMAIKIDLLRRKFLETVTDDLILLSRICLPLKIFTMIDDRILVVVYW